MSATVLTGITLISAALILLTLAILTPPATTRTRTLNNLQRTHHHPTTGQPEPPQDPTPTLTALARRLSTPGTASRLERLLSRAGRPPAWPLERLLAVKLVLPVIIAALAALYITTTPGKLPILLGATATVIAHFLPELLLHSHAQKRSQQIALELADTLDQMTIAVEAGLGFDSAIARAGRNGTGPLAAELIRTLQDIQVGQSRRQAFESLANRTDTPDLRRFVRAILQADAYGVSIAAVLRTQASEMRLKRRQRAEEKAMQIPVKVIFPLMLCILPVLFIVLLGPAVMDIMKAFS